MSNQPATATDTKYLTVNIGPGPNSTACLIVEGVTLSTRELEYLKNLVLDEDDDPLRHACEFLMATRGGEIKMAGAHHEIESYEAEGTPVIDYQACLFCGEKYRWAIRCSGNSEGLI
jgi:CYTH domain-containing protein